MKVKHDLTPEQMTIAELQVCKGRCFLETLFFTRYMFKGMYGRSFVVGEHHEIIAKTLDRVYRGECKRLIINVAPRYGKTELAVKNFIAKGLGINPAAKFIHLSYSDTLALDNSEGVKDIIKSERYKQLYPEVKIKKYSDSKQKWYTESGGGVYSAAAGGQVTGFGAGRVDEEGGPIPDDWFAMTEKFAGAIIIDDPIKPEDAHYDTKRNQVNERFDSTIVNRVNSRNTPIIIIMQRVHTDDLSGHIIKNYPGFEVVSLPAIKADGTALWPFKHTLEELYEQRRINEFVFDTQMMQDPRPKHGQLFPKSELRTFRPDPARKFESAIGYIDVADEGDDYTSAPLAQNIGPDIYITDVVFNQLNSDHNVIACAEMFNKANAEYVRCESNGMGAKFGRDLGKILKGTVYPSQATTNKHTRIIIAAGFIKKHCLFLEEKYWSDEYRDFMTCMYAYLKTGKTKHDDAPDSMEGVTKFIEHILSHYYE